MRVYFLLLLSSLFYYSEFRNLHCVRHVTQYELVEVRSLKIDPYAKDIELKGEKTKPSMSMHGNRVTRPSAPDDTFGLSCQRER